MKIFKFGGTSIQDANHIIQVANILKSDEHSGLVIVVSAMGKMTNAFESLIAPGNNDEEKQKWMRHIRHYHLNIINELFGSIPEECQIENYFTEIDGIISNPADDYDVLYDKVVSYGELISSKILQLYLKKNGVKTRWTDARKLIYTDGYHRKAQVIWDTTCRNIRKSIQEGQNYITQGFIAGSDTGTVTLGREGSDYTAAVFAYCTQAESVTIWKDVPGVLNADPRYFSQYELLDKISYNEALEMSFYGASIIHPKTIKPLQNKNIPLYVKSFLQPSEPGSLIYNDITDKAVPRFILKKNQILLSVSTKDYSFIIEKHISRIFHLFSENKITVNLIQNSAISFSVCLEDPFRRFEFLVKQLQNEFKVRYNRGVKLLTIRHYDELVLKQTLLNNKVLLVQKTPKTAQFIIEGE